MEFLTTNPNTIAAGTVENQSELLIYPLENEFIGKIIVNDDKNDKTKASKGILSTIVILDRSSSMGTETNRFVNKILPQVFHKLDYSPDAVIYLITFDSDTENIKTSVGVLHQLPIYSRGCTYMRSAIEELKNILMNVLPKNQHAVRLLTISDGEIYDQEESVDIANQLAVLIKTKFQLNSQAVRLFSSNNEPDTRALSSLLQLNNLVIVNLLDLSTNLSDDEMSTAISNLFHNDRLGSDTEKSFKSEEKIFKICPWMTEYSNHITLLPGENIFWVDKMPSKPLVCENVNVQIHMQPEVNLETFENILENKVEEYKTQLRILKVVNTPQSTTTINGIVNYFENREKYLKSKELNVQPRLQYLKTNVFRRNNSVAKQMSKIANEKLSQLNSAQQAEYIRTGDTPDSKVDSISHTHVQDIDFNDTIRKEVRALSANIDELKNINDENHCISFYSKKTTLSGIRKLCEFAKESILDDLSANDIILMFNVVGIAYLSTNENLSDSKSKRFNELYLQCYISISDVLTYLIQTKGTILKMPNTGKEITAVIPVFEDQKVADFLRKYSPSLLEYACSIDLNRVVTNMGKTCDITSNIKHYFSNSTNFRNDQAFAFKNSSQVNCEEIELKRKLVELESLNQKLLKDIKNINMDKDVFQQEIGELKNKLFKLMENIQSLNQGILDFKNKIKDDAKIIHSIKEENNNLKEVIIYNNIELKNKYMEIEVLKTYICSLE